MSVSTDCDRLVAAAGNAHLNGRFVEAEGFCRETLALDRENVQAKLILGVVSAKQGQYENAMTVLNEVLKVQTNSFEALIWLSVALRKVGQLHNAAAVAQRALDLRPGDAYALNNLGVCELALWHLPEAASHFSKATVLKPQMAAVFHNLGTALQLQGQDAEAAQAFRRAIAAAPNSVESIVALGHAALSQDDPGGAVGCGRQALRINSSSAPANLLVALGLIHAGKALEARPYLDLATALDPNEAYAFSTLGSSLQTLGRVSEANAAFEKSIEVQPRQGYAYFALVHNQKIGIEDRTVVDQMDELVSAGDLAPKEIGFLRYGLAKAYEDLGEYESAMRHLDEANRIAHSLKLWGRKFDKDAYSRAIDSKIRFFSKEFIDQNRHRGSNSRLPIFIVGMPRSGTTLVEQIVSSHPRVEGAGELDFWVSRGDEAVSSRGLNWEKLRELGGSYLNMLRGLAPSAIHVTDKMPANAMYLGLIHLAFPFARIIHTRRNPVDTCISIYATPNRRAIDYAHDKENITFAYEQYQCLMAHWRAVLPPDRLLELDYEGLVTDQELLTRRMIEFIGLEWSDACLRYEDNERAVVTPSVWQVRQPIYSSSVERWKRFRPWLGPFRRLLDEAPDG